MRLRSHANLQNVTHPLKIIGTHPKLLMQRGITTLALPALQIKVSSSLTTRRRTTAAALADTLDADGNSDHIAILPLSRRDGITCILTHASRKARAHLQRTKVPTRRLPTINSVTLCSTSLSAIILNATKKTIGRATTTTILQLQPHLQKLLTTRILRSLTKLSSSLHIDNRVVPHDNHNNVIPFTDQKTEDRKDIQARVTPTACRSRRLISIHVAGRRAAPICITYLVVSDNNGFVALRPTH